MFQTLIDWFSDSSNSNAVRAIVALLAVPGTLWGLWLFVRWMRGKGLDSTIDGIKSTQRRQALLNARTRLNNIRLPHRDISQLKRMSPDELKEWGNQYFAALNRGSEECLNIFDEISDYIGDARKVVDLREELTSLESKPHDRRASEKIAEIRLLLAPAIGELIDKELRVLKSAK